MPDDAIRKQTAALLRGGLKTTQGTLVLYPDRLVHVGSAFAAAGPAFGALGVLVGSAMTKRNADRKASAGGKGVTTIPLSDIVELRQAKQGLGKNLLEVATTGGETFKFGAKYDRWRDDIVPALEELGRSAVDDGEGTVRVS